MDEAKQQCPSCGYPTPIPARYPCSECGKDLEVVLAEERHVDGTRRFAIMFFVATLGPLGSELIYRLLFLSHAVDSFRQSGPAVQAFALALYALQFACATMAAWGLVLSVRCGARQLGAHRSVKWLAIGSLIGVLVFLTVMPLI